MVRAIMKRSMKIANMSMPKVMQFVTLTMVQLFFEYAQKLTVFAVRLNRCMCKLCSLLS